jgi:hypothetical protein
VQDANGYARKLQCTERLRDPQGKPAGALGAWVAIDTNRRNRRSANYDRVYMCGCTIHESRGGVASADQAISTTHVEGPLVYEDTARVGVAGGRDGNIVAALRGRCA